MATPPIEDMEMEMGTYLDKISEIREWEKEAACG